MRPDSMELDVRGQASEIVLVPTRLDLDGVALALRGGSIIDWTRASFRTIDEVYAFLRLWHCDVTHHPWARERLRYVYNQAVNYLEENLLYHIPDSVRKLEDVPQAFLLASNRRGFSRDQITFCAVLKLMHVINHLEMQELRNQVAVRELDLIGLANEVVLHKARAIRAEGFPIDAFYGNRKTRPSVITKLLAKRESTAATVFDKLRFRIVTRSREDLVPVLCWLFRHLAPFPTIIPGESHNNLLDDDDVARYAPDPGPVRSLLERMRLPTPHNPESGDVYRAINFIVGLPVRIYDLPGVPPPKHRWLLGEAVPVLVEFQLVDADTDRFNETGSSRHELYKERQRIKVNERLGRGSPRGRGRDRG